MMLVIAKTMWILFTRLRLRITSITTLNHILCMYSNFEILSIIGIVSVKETLYKKNKCNRKSRTETSPTVSMSTKKYIEFLSLYIFVFSLTPPHRTLGSWTNCIYPYIFTIFAFILNWLIQLDLMQPEFI